MAYLVRNYNWDDGNRTQSFTFTDKRIRNICNIKVFVDAEPDDRVIRIIKRDIQERGRSIEEVLDRYQSTLKPMHQEFIEPTKSYADIIIPNDNYNNVAIDVVRTVINERLDRK